VKIFTNRTGVRKRSKWYL